MSTDRDTTRIVRSWLEEGVTTLPDRVLDIVLDQVPATPQRRSWWPARRFANMNPYARAAAAAAAVLVVAVVGYQLLPSNAGPGTPTTPPSQKPTPTARPLPAGSLEPGAYFLDRPDRSPVRFTFAVQDGWSARFSDWDITKNTETPASFGFKAYVVTHVFRDACKDEGTLTEIGPTVDDLVRALVDQVNSDASTPIDLTIGGYPAKRVDMSVPAGLDTQTCSQPGILIRIWAEPDFEYQPVDWFAIGADTQNTDAAVRVYIVDVGGKRVVFTAGHPVNAPAADIAELDAVIASIRFEP